MKEKSDSWWQ